MRRPPHEQNRLEPLAPEMEALLAAERRAPAPPAARQALILSRLQTVAAATGAATAAGLAGTAAAATAAPAAATTSAAVAGVALSKPLLLLLATTTAVAAVGGGVAVSRRQAKAPATVTAARPTRETTVVRPPVANEGVHDRAAVEAAPPLGPPPAPPMLDMAAVARPPAKAAPARAPKATWPDIAGEAAILEQARLALAAGDPIAALADLERHGRRFPRGSLAEEREALAIRALAHAGRRTQAQGRAEAFARRYPDSVQGEAIARALREIH